MRNDEKFTHRASLCINELSYTTERQTVRQIDIQYKRMIENSKKDIILCYYLQLETIVFKFSFWALPKTKLLKIKMYT